MRNNSWNDKIEMLKHTMNRYDHYYDSINNKGNLYLTLNTFLFGGVITGYYAIKESISGQCDILFFAWICLICCLLSLGLTLWAITPHISKQAGRNNGSVLFFGDVSNFSFESFKKKYDEMTEDKIYEDYLQQVHLLASGLYKKFRRLQWATYLLGLCFFCILIIGFKILK